MLPRVGCDQAGKHAQERRLPCPVVAQDCVQPPRGKFSADAAQRGKTAELLDQCSQRDDGSSVQRYLEDSRRRKLKSR